MPVNIVIFYFLSAVTKSRQKEERAKCYEQLPCNVGCHYTSNILSQAINNRAYVINEMIMTNWKYAKFWFLGGNSEIIFISIKYK